MSKLARAI